MFLVIDPDLKRAFADLFSDQPAEIPDWQHGSTVPLEVCIARRIVNPQTPRIRDPLNIMGWSMRAAVGKGFLPPVAGSWFIVSGISIGFGTVTVNKRYKIISYVAGDDFTNIGAAFNATGQVFTATGTTPTVWANGSTLQEATADIVYNPTAANIQAALDATAWETTAGGIVVAGEDGFFTFTFAVAGTRFQMGGDGDNLAPSSVLDFGTLLEGATGVSEVQVLRIVQNPGALATLSVASDPPAAAVTPVQTGGGGLNAKARVSTSMRSSGALITGGIYRIELYVAGDDFVNVGGTNVTGDVFTATGTTPTTWTNKSVLSRVGSQPPYDGQFTLSVRGLESAMINYDADAGDVQEALENLTITNGLLVVGSKYKIVSYLGTDDFTNVGAASNATGVVFVASGTTPTDWAGLSVLSPVGAGNVSVSKETNGQYLFAFQGDMANTDMGVISADGSGLRVMPTLSGELDLANANIDLLLDGVDETPVDFEVEATPPEESLQKLFREDGTLRDSIMDPSNFRPPATGSWVPSTVAGKYRFKDDGSFQLWNADQNKFHTLTISGAAGAEIINIAAGEV